MTSSYHIKRFSDRLLATDGESRPTSFAYDKNGQLVQIEDPASNVTSFSYDAAGNRIQMSDALSRETEFDFDALDRLIKVRELEPELTTAFAYDAAGNVILVTDPKDQRTAYDYDPLSRLRTVTQELGLQTTGDPDDFQVGYTYDARGRLETVTNARGHVLTYGYFAWGGLETVDHDLPGTGDDRTVSYTYDDAGNVRSTSDSAVTTGAEEGSDPTIEPEGRLYTLTYDELNRVETVTAHFIPGGSTGEGRTLTSGYDTVGNRTDLDLTGAGESDSHTWHFDAFDRLDEAILPPGDADPTMIFAYNDLDWTVAS